MISPEAILGALVGWITVSAAASLKPKTAAALGLVVGLLWSLVFMAMQK